MVPESTASAASSNELWRVIVALPGFLDALEEHQLPAGIGQIDGLPSVMNPADSKAVLLVNRDRTLTTVEPAEPTIKRLIDLYAPICLGNTGSPFVIAHLGQSLDGRIALDNGKSHYINGAANLDHLHRLRALCDAVIIGRATAELDRPQLTTRRVDGPDPIRVVLDPGGKLAGGEKLYLPQHTRTWVFHGQTVAAAGYPQQVEAFALDDSGSQPSANQVINRLAERGIRRILIEGGGVTVSGFLKRNLVNRLHLAIAPLLLGSGRPSLILDTLTDLKNASRPAGRWIAMGQDMLFDCALKAGAKP